MSRQHLVQQAAAVHLYLYVVKCLPSNVIPVYSHVPKTQLLNCVTAETLTQPLPIRKLYGFMA